MNNNQKWAQLSKVDVVFQKIFLLAGTTNLPQILDLPLVIGSEVLAKNTHDQTKTDCNKKSQKALSMLAIMGFCKVFAH